MPILEAMEADASLTEWVSNTSVSTPTASNQAFCHLAMKLKVTAMCGLIIAIKSLFSPSLRDSVFLSYSYQARTGQSFWLPGKDGKNSAIALSYHDCFTRFTEMEATPSSLRCFLVLSSWDRSANLDGHLIARRKAVFHDSYFNGRDPKSPSASI